MATLTIRDLDDSIKEGLRVQAARHGCSMEQEVRDILRRAVEQQTDGATFSQRVRQRFQGVEIDALPIPERRPTRRPPDAGER